MNSLLILMGGLVIISIVRGSVMVLQEIWNHCKSGRKSLANAMAITFMIAEFPILVISSYFEKGKNPCFFESLAIVVMYLAGITGALGLVLDRRVKKKKQHAGSKFELLQ
ncbi:MAG: hypothetical protein WCJ40_19420 [Planctomycetota bacterium]